VGEILARVRLRRPVRPRVRRELYAPASSTLFECDDGDCEIACSPVQEDDGAVGVKAGRPRFVARRPPQQLVSSWRAG